MAKAHCSSKAVSGWTPKRSSLRSSALWGLTFISCTPTATSPHPCCRHQQYQVEMDSLPLPPATSPHLPRRRAEGGQEMDSPPVPSELLVDIFLRLADPADLVRASAACVPFRRLVTDRSFLRQYRKLHAPPLLGFVEVIRGRYPARFHRAVAPYPSASAARAVSLAADFTFSFLPAPARAWVVQDVRDGRVLLHRAEPVSFFTEMAVCDPLHRRHLLLPPIPDHLAASVKELFPVEPRFWCEIFLAPPEESEPAAEEEGTSFRVVWMAQCKTRLFGFVFSSGTGQWRAVPSQRWTGLFAGSPSLRGTLFRSRQYSCGRFFWRADVGEDRYMLVLDARIMEFTFAEPPPEARSIFTSAMGMVEAGGSRPGMFVIKGGESAIGYYVGGSSLSQWHKEKTISLDYKHTLACSTERCLLLFESCSGFHTLDAKTFQLEKMFYAGVYSFDELRAYSNFPPSFLSLPTISTGAEMMKRWNMTAVQAQAHSHHGQNTADANAGGQAHALLIRDGAKAATQLDH